MSESIIIFLLIVVTFLAYFMARWLYLKFKHPLLNIVIVGALMVIFVLVFFDIPYETYVPAQNIMAFLLGPATVGLAVPLYRNRHLLKEYGTPIFCGVGAGTIVSMLTVLLITKYGGLPKEVVASIIPKSSTIPFAVDISRILGGDAAVAVVFVVATGTAGNFIGLTALNWFKIHNPIARGLSMGTLSHGQGVAASFLEGEKQGSMAGVAMALAGVFTSLFAPLIWFVFY
jgi:predicted murein hydrolase (TIGR00659 family)